MNRYMANGSLRRRYSTDRQQRRLLRPAPPAGAEQASCRGRCVFQTRDVQSRGAGHGITPSLIDQLKGSMVRAQAKGATNILAMDTEKASIIINVPSAKVITAITQDEMKDSVFTNIDGAVFL
ncbi:MAG: flagellar biosynthesis protein [Oscillospiraceae bacterium]